MSLKDFVNPQKKITNYLVGLNIVIFALMFLNGGFGAFNTTKVLVLFGAQFTDASISDLLYSVSGFPHLFRIVTAMFTHGGILHIFLNMYALFYFGNLVENIYGPFKYFSIYILSGISGNLLTQLLMPNSISVGASGAIFGLMGLLFGSGFRKDTPSILRPITGSALAPVVLINIIFGFMPGTNINNFAHIGGLICGFTFGWITSVNYSKFTNIFWKVTFFVLMGTIAAAYGLLIFTNIQLMTLGLI